MPGPTKTNVVDHCELEVGKRSPASCDVFRSLGRDRSRLPRLEAIRRGDLEEISSEPFEVGDIKGILGRGMIT